MVKFLAKCTRNCLNGGECELTDDGGICLCPEGYTGDYCEQGDPLILLYSNLFLFRVNYDVGWQLNLSDEMYLNIIMSSLICFHAFSNL